jgi:hypothetical protein
MPSRKRSDSQQCKHGPQPRTRTLHADFASMAQASPALRGEWCRRAPISQLPRSTLTSYTRAVQPSQRRRLLKAPRWRGSLAPLERLATVCGLRRRCRTCSYGTRQGESSFWLVRTRNDASVHSRGERVLHQRAIPVVRAARDASACPRRLRTVAVQRLPARAGHRRATQRWRRRQRGDVGRWRRA